MLDDKYNSKESNDDRLNQVLPSELGNVIKDTFNDFYDCYIETCTKLKHLDGQEMTVSMTKEFFIKYTQN